MAVKEAHVNDENGDIYLVNLVNTKSCDMYLVIK